MVQPYRYSSHCEGDRCCVCSEERGGLPLGEEASLIDFVVEVGTGPADVAQVLRYLAQSAEFVYCVHSPAERTESADDEPSKCVQPASYVAPQGNDAGVRVTIRCDEVHSRAVAKAFSSIPTRSFLTTQLRLAANLLAGESRAAYLAQSA